MYRITSYQPVGTQQRDGTFDGNHLWTTCQFLNPLTVAVCFGNGCLVIFVAGQLLEGYVFQPKFIGDRVGLHPVTLMFALFAFGSLFNFVGLLIAVPAAAAIGVLVRFSLQQYLQSPYYQGQAPGDGEQQ